AVAFVARSPAGAVESHRPELDAVEAFDGLAHLFADAPGRCAARVACGGIEVHGQRAADLLERALDELDPVEAEHRLLDPREDGGRRVERSAPGELDLEADLVGLLGLLREAAD